MAQNTQQTAEQVIEQKAEQTGEGSTQQTAENTEYPVTLQTDENLSLGEKQRRAHENLHDRYKLAMKHKFYYEAMVLVYNLMEDRLVAFMHCAGFVDKDEAKPSLHRIARKPAREVMNLKPEKQLNIRSIDNKIKLIEGLMQIDPETTWPLLKEIDARAQARLDREEVLETLEACRAWKNARNPYIHALLKMYNQPENDQLKAFVEDGMSLARKLDKYVSRFAPSKGQKGIREKFKLQPKSR